MNKVMVRINGSEYPMVGPKSERHMLSVASYVDQEMTKAMEKNPKLSSSVAAILTALNIADVFFECSDSNDELVKENEDLKKKVGINNGELKIEIRKLELSLQNKEDEIKSQKEQIEALKKELEEAKKNTSDVEAYKSEIEELKEQVTILEEKATVAEKLSSKFQNDAYRVQLEKIEIENEVKFLRAQCR